MAIGAKKRLRIYRRDKFKCQECGHDKMKDLTIDHIHPISRGGTDEDNNLRTLCKNCNLKKGDTINMTWYQRIFLFFFGDLLDNLQKELLKVIIEKNNQTSRDIVYEIKLDMQNRFNQATPKFSQILENKFTEVETAREIKIVSIKNRVTLLEKETHDRDDKLLTMFYVMCDYIEELEKRI